MNEPKISQKAPYAIPVEKGKIYYWCSCGLSDEQPFCSGAHKGTAFKPLRFEAEESKTVWFCGCKRTRNPPFCDGTHRRLAP